MRPYYEHAGIAIYHGDCREVLPSLAGADLVLTDPPYGLDWKPTGFQQAFKTDWQAAARWDVRPTTETFHQITRAAKEWIIWGGNYFASDLGDCKAPLVWDKQTGDNNFADGEMAFTSFASGTLRLFRHQWCGAFKASERGVQQEHPTQKPVALMKWAISQAECPTSILDPFMGSGTTLVAAKQLGLQAMGIEIAEEYCEIAARRLAQDVLDFSPSVAGAPKRARLEF